MANRNKYIVLLGLAIILTNPLFAQQKPSFSQYMFNHLSINPAYAGNQKVLSATALYRKQWINFDGAPSVQTFSAHTALKNKRVGLGFTVTNDRIGVHNDLGIYGSYSYYIPFGKGKLSMGIMGGFNNITSNYELLNRDVPSDAFLSGVNNDFQPNFGTGLFYSTSTEYIGFSIPYLLTNSTLRLRDKPDSLDLISARYYFLTAGKVFDIAPEVKVKPSALLRFQEHAPVGFDLNVNFFFYDAVAIGASYRNGDALVFLFELQTNENFKFGYSYDYILSDIRTYSKGTHEIMVNYMISLTKEHCNTYF